MEDGDGTGVTGAQERHHKLPERTLSWDTNYDKEGSFNHIPLLTTGRSVSGSRSLFCLIQFCLFFMNLELNWAVLMVFNKVSGELSAASPERLSMASPESGSRGKFIHSVSRVIELRG